MDEGSHERTPNRTLLREIASVLGSESWIEKISVFPVTRPESLVVVFLSDHYPQDYVREAYLEIQSYTNGDFHVTYIENQHGTSWTCRWDRHESPEYTRDHFHAPPTARHEDGQNREYPAELLSVLSAVVVPWIYDRMGEVWDEHTE